jgi:hydroxymethylglutaryl-CoA lyase
VAAGNVATEDLVHGLQRAGQRTDIDLAALIGVAKDVARHLGRDLPGRVYKTGPILEKALNQPQMNTDERG